LSLFFVFWLKGEYLYTPKIKHSGVAGLYRADILNKYPNTNIVEAKQDDIHSADAMFMTNSVMEIVPIKRFNQRELNIEKVHQFKSAFEKISQC